MNSRMIVVGAVVLGVVAAALIVPRLASSVSDSFNQVTGREDLRVLEREAILDFRAPGTTLRRTTKVPASSGPLGQSPVPTSVEQVFAVDGDPLTALSVVRDAAQADGWELVGPWCSRYQRAAAFVFGKRTPIPSAMTTRVVLPGAPGRRARAHGHADGGRLALPRVRGHAAARRRHRVPPVDRPRGPRVRGAHRTPAHLRRAVRPVARGLRAQIVPEVTVALPDEPDYEGGNVCAFEERPYRATSTVLAIQGTKDSLWWFSVVDVAALPRVLFEDRQYPSPRGDPEMFLVAFDVRREPPPLGVWVRTPSGPVLVRTSVDGLDEQQLLAVARLLRGEGGACLAGPRPAARRPRGPPDPGSPSPRQTTDALDPCLPAGPRPRPRPHDRRR